MNSIKQIGYAPFDYSTPSDHRPLIIEFHTASLFGKTYIDSLLPHNRGVKSNDKVSVQKFIDIMYDEVTKRKGFELLDRLNNNVATTHLVEQVDQILGQSGDIAESQCRRRRPEFYSRSIIQHRLRVSILRGHLNALKSGRDRREQLQRKMQRAGIEMILPATIRLTRMSLHSAKTQLQEVSQNSMTVRHSEFADKLNNVDSNTVDRQTRKALRAIQKVEANMKTYKTLQAMRTSSGTIIKLDRVEIPATWPPPGHPITSLTQLEDPKTCTQWRMVTNPPDIEYYLMLRNRLHFGQAQGTPFTILPLQDDFDWEARSTAADLLLQGQYSTSTTTSQCQELLKACKAQAEPDTIPQELTVEEFRGKIIAWRETTTTSPSGRHLGRYKSLFRDGLPQQEDDNVSIGTTVAFAAKQEKLTKLVLAVINYCIRNTYVLDRWKTIVNVMIFKELGNFKIHRLRVIHIYEADFNLILAVKWRQLLHSATDRALINHGQYGGRPGCEAQSLTLLEELKYDISYLTRRTLFNFDNDATSCYDRIVVPLASVINRKYGMHRNVVAVHARTLQQAKFHLKTAAGISEIHYTHCPSFPIHGTGQGSGNSPCIWLFISSTLFDIHGSKAHGATFVSPDGQRRVHLSMVGFVDDSTGSLNDFQPSSQAPLSVLFQRMTHDAQLWNDLLYCSGGKLELPKCSFHALHFDFHPSGKPQPTLEKFDNKVHIRDADTKMMIPIPAKRPFETHKTLGHTKAPSPDVSKEITALKHKSEQLALLIATSPITRRGAMLAYLTVFIPSIQYTLPQSFYPQKILEQAQASSISHIIAKCGYNRNTARALIYAPTYYAGGGFLPWHLLQGEGQIQHFIKHWRTDTIVSSTLRIALHWTQWQSGHHAPILEDTNTPLTYLECRWIRSLRDFLSTINARIYLDATGISLPERRNDIYIMTYARESGLFDTQDIAIINYCRLFLHVTTVSELFDAEGKHILIDAFECRREPWFNPHTYITRQRRPSAHQIRTKWQRLCREWSRSDGSIASSIRLGRWATTGDQLRRRRQTYRPQATPNILYHWHGNAYWVYHPIQPGSNQYRPICPSEWTPTVPCTPLTVQIAANNIITTRPPRDQSVHRRTPSVVISFESYVSKLLSWEQPLLQGVQFHYSPYETRQYIHNRGEEVSLLLVSDGSQRGSHLSYGWVFGTESGVILAEHSGHGYGSPTSHRAEAWGMLSATVFVNHLIVYTAGINHDFPLHAKLTFCSDNSGLIQRVVQRRKYTSNYPNSTLSADWELIEQIYDTANNIPISVSYEWVRGHQDANHLDLTTSAKYNVRADELAGNVPIDTNRQSAPPSMLSAEKCRLVVNNFSVHGHYKTAIRHAYTTPPLQAYLTCRHGWSQQTLSDIDWDLFERAASNMSVSPVQLMKLVHDKLPTRHELAKSNPFQSKTCKHCEADETFYHLVTCCNPLSTKFRQNVYDRVDVYFQNTNTPVGFQKAFHRGLDQCFFTSSPRHASHGTGLDHSQQTIGWHLMLKGYWTKSWRQQYTRCCSYDSALPPSRPLDYLANLLRLIWTEQLQFWTDHQKVNNPSSTVGHPRQPEDKLLQYKARIRVLHAKKSQCLHGHRELYFHADVEEFLQDATGSQMKHYLHNYEQAIYDSIKHAQRVPLRSIFTFPGYTRTPAQRTTPRPIGHPPDPFNSNSSTATRGNVIPHKHTRWKKFTKSITSIRHFFSPAP
jgi:hypothetical protein